MFHFSCCLDSCLLRCKNKNLVFHPEVKGHGHKRPPSLMAQLIYDTFQTFSSLSSDKQAWGWPQQTRAAVTLLQIACRDAICARPRNNRLHRRCQIPKQKFLDLLVKYEKQHISSNGLVNNNGSCVPIFLY